MVAVAHSIFDTEALRERLKGEFPGAPAFDACRLHRSFINDTYQLEARGKLYYLRVYRRGWRSFAQVSAEMKIIEAVADRGGRVALPVRRHGGRHVLLLEAPEAPRPAVLFEEAPGADLVFSAPEGPARAVLYGRAAAALHLAMDGLPNVPDRPDWLQGAVLDHPVAVIGEAMDAEAQARLEAVADRLRDALAAWPELTIALCHGDLNSSNLHFVGEAGTVIDFDCAAWGWRSNDIAAFSRGVTLQRRPGEEASALISGFLEGYQAVRPIPPQDYEALPAFLLIQRIWMTSLHLEGRDDRWGANSFGPRYVRRFSDWLEAWTPVLDRRPGWLG